MSKHRHRNRSNESNNMRRNQAHGPMNNNPFGINPQQLLAMLGGNMDIGGLGSMLQSMNRDGFDLNSINQQMNGNNGLNFNNIMGAMNNIRNNMNNNPINTNDANSDSSDINANFKDISFDSSELNQNNNMDIDESNIINTNKKHKGSKKDSKTLEKDNIEDENIQILKALRNIVDPNKIEFVDKMIEVYMNGGFKEI